MSDSIRTLGESNQDAIAIRFPDDRGYACSNLFCEVLTWATVIEILFLRSTKMLLLSNTTSFSMSSP